MADEILVQQDGPILRVTLNAAGSRQRRHRRQRPRADRSSIDRRAKKSDIVVLRGAGKRFLRRPRRHGQARAAVEPHRRYARRQLLRRGVRLPMARCAAAPIPVIAVVQGRARTASAAPSPRSATLRFRRATRRVLRCPEMAHNIMPTMVLSSFVDRVPRKAMAYLVYSMFEVCARARPVLRHRQRRGAGRRSSTPTVDRLTAAMLKAPSISLPQRQGIHPHRARHAGRRRGGIRAKPARHDQFGGGDQEAARTARVMAGHSRPKDGVLLVAYARPSAPCFASQGVDARHKARP